MTRGNLGPDLSSARRRQERSERIGSGNPGLVIEHSGVVLDEDVLGRAKCKPCPPTELGVFVIGQA